jgi:putative ABC transport system substrate-binding protein
MPLLSLAQETRLRRVGFLYFGTERSARELGRYQGFIEGMRESGYVLGKDFMLEARYGDGDPKWLAAMAAELVKMNVEVIVTGGTAANYAAQAVTKTIPIVITNSPDPVREGFAASLARPGGNVTGFSTNTAEIDAKHVELLKACLPRLALLAVLQNPANRAHRSRMKSVEATAQRHGAKTLSLTADTVEAIDAAFAALRQARADAVVVLGDTFYAQQARQIARLALELKLPSIYVSPENAQAGGLMTYGQNITDNFRRAAKYVDRILKGAKPGELPIEQPTKFELVINLQTAKAIGLSIPSSVLLRADRVIQ